MSVIPSVSITGGTPEVHSHDSSASFKADRRVATGDIPPGLARFLAAYPANRAHHRPQIVAAWEAGGCEDETDGILAGLAAHKRGKDFKDGVIVNAETFLIERRWLSPPDPVKGGEPPPSTIPKASDADQRRFRTWWNRLSTEARDAWAAERGIARSVVDQASNHQTLRAEWVKDVAAVMAAAGGAA